MRELSEAYAEGSAERELLETYLQALLDYELICNAGIAVSNLVEDGCAPDEIDYDKVLDYLKSQESENNVKRGWEYIAKAFETSDRDVLAWLGGIIDIQCKEVLNHDKVSLKTESKDGTDHYRIDVTDTPKRVIDVPALTVTANSGDEIFGKSIRTFYGTRTLGGTEGESADDYMSATDSSYLIPKFDGQWYAVQDAEGTVHLASDASDHSVYAKFYSMDGKSMGTGELIFDADGNADSIYIYGNTMPIRLYTFEEVVMVALCNDPGLGDASTIGTFMLQGTNTKLVKDSYSNLGIGDVEIKLAISDMYVVQHEVKPSLSFDPNGGTWADGGTDVREYEAGLETEFEVIGAPTRDGYTFVCWKGSEYQPGDKYLADSDHAFTAQWKKNDSSGDDKPTPTPAPAKPARASKPTTTVHPAAGTIDASWKKAKGAKAYQVQWRAAGGKWRTKRVRKTRYTIPGLRASTPYEVRVRVVDGSAKGTWFKVTRRWLKGASKVRAKPGKSKGSVKVSWRKDRKATGGYKVFVYAKRGGKVVATKTVSRSKASATVKGLKSGKTYYVRVRPYRTKGSATYVGAISGYRSAKAK